jgi:hypothetical protein
MGISDIGPSYLSKLIISEQRRLITGTTNHANCMEFTIADKLSKRKANHVNSILMIEVCDLVRNLI